MDQRAYEQGYACGTVFKVLLAIAGVVVVVHFILKYW